MKKNSLSFQTMMHSVEKIVSDISQDDCDLDKVILKVEKGYEILKEMKQRLSEAKNKIEELKNDYEEHEQLLSSKTE